MPYGWEYASLAILEALTVALVQTPSDVESRHESLDLDEFIARQPELGRYRL